MQEQEYFIKYDKWCFYFNTGNYKIMKGVVRNAFKKIFHNIELKSFDTKNVNHNKYDDWLRCECEMELNRRDIDLEKYESDTYNFLHHLQFVDKNEQRNLHETLRNFIFSDDNEIINNYIYDDDSDFECDD